MRHVSGASNLSARGHVREASRWNCPGECCAERTVVASHRKPDHHHRACPDAQHAAADSRCGPQRQ